MRSSWMSSRVSVPPISLFWRVVGRELLWFSLTLRTCFCFCLKQRLFRCSAVMDWFSCLLGLRKDDYSNQADTASRSSSRRLTDSSGSGKQKACLNSEGKNESNPRHENSAAFSFTFRELAAATGNFREVNIIGEGGFGKVYKGRLGDGKIVAIKQLNQNGVQGYQQFVVEVLMLCLLHHPNLVTLIGYCTEGDQRLLVYEYMPMGSLEKHLFGPNRQQLSWLTRMKIAAGAARGLEYLHCKADPPVIIRDLKPANILLDNDFNPKLSDFGLAKLGPVGDKTHVSTRIMGTYGYCAPDYAMSGKLTVKSDIYSFGVVLLELITGKMAIDPSKRREEQNLISWARPFMKNQRKYAQIVDPSLRGCVPLRSLNHAVAITAMCLQEQAAFRPLIGNIVEALDYVVSEIENAEMRKGAAHEPHK